MPLQRNGLVATSRSFRHCTGWIISQHVNMNGHKNHSALLVGAPFLGL